ncbi:MAG: ORF6N domain-containing protein [Chloroflexi bacterium]|nr:ORF6N domain-containing protein [Chloroflexota bacterium]
MLDADLAALYGVETKILVQSVKRNIKRFPADFMFQLSKEEFDDLRFHFSTSSDLEGREEFGVLRSQIVTSSGWGGRRYPPYAFTEQGVAMLSSVLRSQRAIQVNIEIMRTFIRLRQMLASHAELARKLDALEKKYDAQFKEVFEVIRQMMATPEPKRPPIGFRKGG